MFYLVVLYNQEMRKQINGGQKNDKRKENPKYY